MAGKDLLSRLADAGEEAIQRLAEAPGTDRLVGVANNMRDRMDELQRRVRGLEGLERRVEALERRLGMSGAGGASGEPAGTTPEVAKELAEAREAETGASEVGSPDDRAGRG